MPGFTALMYHEIVPDGSLPPVGRPVRVASGYRDTLPPPLFVEAAVFEGQIDALLEARASIISAADIRRFYLEQAPLPPRAVLLTFDDLYHSVLDVALPILESRGLTATGFVVTSWIHDAPRPRDAAASVTLSWPELERLRSAIDFANHSDRLHARNKNGAGVLLADRQTLIADTQAAGERVELADVYAYPFGAATEEHAGWLGDAEISLAFTTQPGYNTATTHRLLLHRNVVTNQTTAADLERLIIQES